MWLSLSRSSRSSGRCERAVHTTWTASLATATLCLMNLKHGDATVFCTAAEVASGAVGATSGRSNVAGQKFAHPHDAFANNLSPAAGRRLRNDNGELHLESHQTTAGQGEGDAGAAPEQIHLALASSGSSLNEYGMTVAWATWPPAESTVIWGPDPDEMMNVVSGTSTSYSANHPGRTPYTSGFLHSATMVGLLPSTTYYYSCGDETLGMSSVRSFITPPPIGGEQTVTLGILGDLGQTDDSQRTLAAIDADRSLDLVLHAGDLSYADCDHPRWDSFLRMLDPVASRLPWMVAAGNHEIEGGSTGGKPFVAYEKRFRMPAVSPPSQSYGCGRGGGLDGGVTGNMCWEGQGADEAQVAATREARRQNLARDSLGKAQFSGKESELAVALAARRVRETFDVHALAFAVEENDEGRGGGGDAVLDQEGEGMELAASLALAGTAVSCCPSEWSGTYDFGNSFYSFDVASAHVVVLNPYTATGENSLQHEWVQKDLEATDRSLTPWVIAVFHCPWYNSNLAHQGERQQETAMRVMEPVLNKHKVAVVVSGHVHAYERSYPVVDHELSEDGPTYLVVGGAGNREGHAAGFYPQPEWSAFRDGTAYGSGRLIIRDSTLALWEWKSTEEGSSIHDVAWIKNPFSPAEPRAPTAGDAADQYDPSRPFDADGGPNREELGNVHLATKFQRQTEKVEASEERAVGATVGGDPYGDGVRADGDEQHAHGHKVGGRLRVPGLTGRSQRFS